LVRDIGYGPGTESFAELNGYVYFANSDPTHGLETWRSDGTPGGTGLFLDAVPSTLIYSDSAPTEFVTAGGKVFFAANHQDPNIGGLFRRRQLWVTDGTTGGTQMLTNLQGGIHSSGPLEPDPRDLTVVGNLVYFTAYTQANGRELWVSDGTSAGTQMVVDLSPTMAPPPFMGPTNTFNTNTHETFVAFGDSIVFNKSNELWISDGTAGGTVQLFTSDSGFDSSPRDLAVVDDTIYFTADLGNLGRELWKSDGTPGGTVLVKNIHTSTNVGSDPTGLVAFGGLLYFRANDGVHGFELWSSDGSEAGTVLVADLRTGPEPSTPGELTVVGSSLYFVADDGVTGRELWITDGTVSGTSLVADFAPGSPSSSPIELTNLSGTLYFVTSGTAGEELWRSNGSLSSTEQVADLIPGPNGSRPRQLHAFGNDLYFVGLAAGEIRTLFHYDPNDASPLPLTSLVPVAIGSVAGGYRHIDGIVYFTANDGSFGTELWRTDGTAEGTVLVKDIRPGDADSGATPLAVLGDRLLFTANDGLTGEEVWITDGTLAGTFRLTDVIPTNVGPANFRAVQFGNHVYFTAAHTGATIFRTDGTVAGTGPLTFPATFNSVATNGQFLFLSNTSAGPLWLSDGTFAGTTQVVDPFGVIPLVSGGMASIPTTSTGVAFFRGSTTSHGIELWKTDGTPAGTGLVKDIRFGSITSNPSDLTLVGDILFFLAEDGVNGRALWRSDGTEAGTYLVSTSIAITTSSLTAAGDILYFTSTISGLGKELWVSDGTGAGTTVVVDLAPGSSSSFPSHLASIGNRIVYEADISSFGAELWISDGTALGTYLLVDFHTGSSDGMANNPDITPVKTALYLTANNGASGEEPWLVNFGPNSAPVAITDGSFELVVGESLTLDASASFDPDSDPALSYFWDLNGDGDYRDAAGKTPTIAWGDLLSLGIDPNGSSFTVSVRVSDGIGGADVATALVPLIPAPAIAIASLGSQQTYHFNLAGDGTLFADTGDGPFSPFATAFDALGNTYVSDILTNRIYKFAPDGSGSIFADLSDGVHVPTHMAFDADGNLFVTSYLLNRVIKLTPAGDGSLFADASDGLLSPFDIAIASTGEIYIASTGNQSVLQFDTAGNASVYADTSDGLFSPFGVAVDSQGDVYVSDVLLSKVFKFTGPGSSTLFADSSDGVQLPAGLTFDADDNLYVANYLHGSIIRLDSSGVPSLFADASDGLSSPFDVAVYTPAPPPLELLASTFAKSEAPSYDAILPVLATDQTLTKAATTEEARSSVSIFLDSNGSSEVANLVNSPQTREEYIPTAGPTGSSISTFARDLALLSTLSSADHRGTSLVDHVFDTDDAWEDDLCHLVDL